MPLRPEGYFKVKVIKSNRKAFYLSLNCLNLHWKGCLYQEESYYLRHLKKFIHLLFSKHLCLPVNSFLPLCLLKENHTRWNCEFKFCYWMQICEPNAQRGWPWVASACYGLELGFPARNWGCVAAVWAPNPNHQTTGQWQGPGSLGLQKRIPTKIENRETNKNIYSEEKKSTACVDRQMGELRDSVWIAELQPFVVWITFMGHFFWVSFGQSFWFAWFTIHIWYISGSLMCAYTSLSQIGF